MLDRRRLICNLTIAAALPLLCVGVYAKANPLFSRLWSSHPMGNGRGIGERWPCANMLNIDCLSDSTNLTRDQCSIRLGISIKGAFPDLKLTDFPKLKNTKLEPNSKWPLVCTNLCFPECAHDENDLHFLRTSELASALLVVSQLESRKFYPKFDWLSTPEIFHRDDKTVPQFRNLIGSRSGVILIENFWDHRYNAMRGSHLDLWHGGLRLTKNELFYRGRNRPDLRYEDLADRIIFWEVQN